MNKKLKYWFRWIAVLPGALIAGLLATFPLRWILYFTFAHGRTISGVNIDPIEYTLYPFVIALIFIFTGYKIAPKYKIKTTIVLFGIYFVVWSVICFITLFNGGFNNIDIQFSSRTILALMGAFTGLYIAKRANKEKVNSRPPFPSPRR